MSCRSIKDSLIVSVTHELAGADVHGVNATLEHSDPVTGAYVASLFFQNVLESSR